jgi:hypothetical protein
MTNQSYFLPYSQADFELNNLIAEERQQYTLHFTFVEWKKNL